MENTTSYSISEVAGMLNLSSKTIRRYIKSGKLPSTKVPTKFGDEYRVTDIPEHLKQEAEAQARAQGTVDIVPEEHDNGLDIQMLYQENMRLAAQLGAATERIRNLEEQIKAKENLLAPAQDSIRLLEEKIKVLETPKPRLPWWKRLFGGD
ncbi:MAG: helix-turn-helix domain-containing protein [Dehalococcoidales bacterium]|nr:helix-turn-helix domain-containing protein [Dehalococcoidales bacterium]